MLMKRGGLRALSSRLTRSKQQHQHIARMSSSNNNSNAEQRSSSSRTGLNIRANLSAAAANPQLVALRAGAKDKARGLANGVRAMPQRAGSSSSTTTTTTANARQEASAAQPPPGHVRPVLLPTYAQLLPARDRAPQTWGAVDAPEDLDDGEVEIFLRLKGFVERWPESRSTAQRIWERAGRQLAGLPKLPPRTGGSSSTPNWDAHRTSLATTSSIVDDAVFFPEVPDAIASSPVGGRTGSHAHDEGLPEQLAESMIEGASDAALEKILGLGGVLPVEEAPDAHGSRKIQRSDTGLTLSPSGDVVPAPGSTSGTASPGAIPLVGGSSAWWGRSLIELHDLTTALESRLRAFWTYREPNREVRIEVLPVFRNDPDAQVTWTADASGATGADANPGGRLIAATRLTTDAAGIIDSYLTIPKHMLERYLKTDPDPNVQKLMPHDIKAVKLRAILTPSPHASTPAASLLGEEPIKEPVVGSWHTLPLQPLHPKHRNVRAISDVDDTVRHSHVLGGARALFRNVFVRPHSEVQIKGVREWYGTLSDLGVGFHYVSNAPCELHGVVRDYLSTAGLPPGHVALKHYPAGNTSSLISTWLQPVVARKRVTLLGIMDDFPNDVFLLMGDSGEMDLEVYTEVALARPGRVAAIYIRDVSGSAEDIAARAAERKGEAAAEMAEKSVSSTLAPPPKALSGSTYPPSSSGASTPARYPPSRTNTSSSLASFASSVTSSASGGSNSSSADAKTFPARLARSRAQLPNDVILSTWREGQDVQSDSEKLVKRLLAQKVKR